MSRLKLIIHPTEILRKKNTDLTFPLSKKTRELIDQMIFDVKRFKGIGLAAPQIGKNLNLAIIALDIYDIPAFPIINPKIISRSFKKIELEEGCLSLPGKFAMVKRPHKIKVKFFDRMGKAHKIKLDGMLAKVFQHEIDHLKGILINDKWDKKTVHEPSEEKIRKIRKSRKDQDHSQSRDRSRPVPTNK